MAPPKAGSPLSDYSKASAFVTIVSKGTYSCSICGKSGSSKYRQAMVQHVQRTHRAFLNGPRPITTQKAREQGSTSVSKVRGKSSPAGTVARGKRPGTPSRKQVQQPISSGNRPAPTSTLRRNRSRSSSPEHEVQRIVGHRVQDGKPEYAVLWAGTDEAGEPDVTWEPLEHLWNSRDKLNVFLKNRGETLIMNAKTKHLSVVKDISNFSDFQSRSVPGSEVRKRRASTSRGESESKKSRSGNSPSDRSKPVTYRPQSSYCVRDDLFTVAGSSVPQKPGDVRVAKKDGRSGRNLVRPSSSWDDRPTSSAKATTGFNRNPSEASGAARGSPLSEHTSRLKTADHPKVAGRRPHSVHSKRDDSPHQRTSIPGQTSSNSPVPQNNHQAKVVPMRRIQSSFAERPKVVKDLDGAVPKSAECKSSMTASPTMKPSALLTSHSVQRRAVEKPTDKREDNIASDPRRVKSAREVANLLTSQSKKDSDKGVFSDSESGKEKQEQKLAKTDPAKVVSSATVPITARSSESDSEDEYDEYIIEDPAKLNRPTGFSLGMVPEKILGIISKSSPVKYVVKWKGNRVAEPVASDILLQEVPKMLVAFLEARIVDNT